MPSDPRKNITGSAAASGAVTSAAFAATSLLRDAGIAGICAKYPTDGNGGGVVDNGGRLASEARACCERNEKYFASNGA